MTNKGDGLDLEIHSGNSGTYIDIDLLVGEEDDESDIDYLIKFLKPFEGGLIEKGREKRLPKFDNYIYVQYSSPKDLETIFGIFKKENIDVQMITETRKTFERGAGDFWLGYL